MTLRKALLILESHQKWRMGDEFAEKTEPKVLTEAINIILQYHFGSTTALIDQVPDVGKMVGKSENPIYLVWDGTGTPPTIRKIDILELSDAEIHKMAYTKYSFTEYDRMNGFVEGMKAYRELLK